MASYYYSGNIVRPIPVSKGRSVAVRPNTKFEVFEETQEIQNLVARGVIRRCGGTKVKGTVPDPPVKIDPKKIPVPQFSRSIAEKGVTSAKGIPPKATGSVEMTEDEVHSVVTDDNKNKKAKKGKR